MTLTPEITKQRHKFWNENIETLQILLIPLPFDFNNTRMGWCPRTRSLMLRTAVNELMCWQHAKIRAIREPLFWLSWPGQRNMCLNTDEQFSQNLEKFHRWLPSLNGHSSASWGAIDLGSFSRASQCQTDDLRLLNFCKTPLHWKCLKSPFQAWHIRVQSSDTKCHFWAIFGQPLSFY